MHPFLVDNGSRLLRRLPPEKENGVAAFTPAKKLFPSTIRSLEKSCLRDESLEKTILSLTSEKNQRNFTYRADQPTKISLTREISQRNNSFSPSPPWGRGGRGVRGSEAHCRAAVNSDRHCGGESGVHFNRRLAPIRSESLSLLVSE
jgi:hypothetical protein